MVIRRTLFVLMCLLASSLYMYGQIAVKTNVAMDAVAIPNLGVEVGLSKKLTLDVPMYYNPWKYSDSKMQGSPKINLPLIRIKYRGIVHEELFIGTKETPMVFSSLPTCVSFIMNNPPFHTQNTPVPFNQRHFIHRKRVFSSKNL